ITEGLRKTQSEVRVGCGYEIVSGIIAQAGNGSGEVRIRDHNLQMIRVAGKLHQRRCYRTGNARYESEIVRHLEAEIRSIILPGIEVEIQIGKPARRSFTLSWVRLEKWVYVSAILLHVDIVGDGVAFVGRRGEIAGRSRRIVSNRRRRRTVGGIERPVDHDGRLRTGYAQCKNCGCCQPCQIEMSHYDVPLLCVPN